MADKRIKTVKNECGVKAVTAFEASKIYPGIEERQFARMCLKGQRMVRIYGNEVPPDKLAKVLFGKKVGKYWLIPLEELDRVFLSTDSATLKV